MSQDQYRLVFNAYTIQYWHLFPNSLTHCQSDCMYCMCVDLFLWKVHHRKYTNSKSTIGFLLYSSCLSSEPTACAYFIFEHVCSSFSHLYIFALYGSLLTICLWNAHWEKKEQVFGKNGTNWRSSLPLCYRRSKNHQYQPSNGKSECVFVFV